MNERYLWDASGGPDHDVQELEQLLEHFRSPIKPAGDWLFARPHRQWAFPPHVLRWCVAVAAVLLVTAAVSVVWKLRRHDVNQPAIAETGWEVTRVDARPSGTKPLRVRRGEWLATDSTSTLEISQTDVGQLELAPNSRLAVLQSDENSERFALTLGRIHALIWATPGRFMVDTPSAEAVDLGCEYNLTVEPDGRGLLAVSFGWVAFRSKGRESFVPAGAFCRTRPGPGPDTPYFGDSSPALQHALETLDNALDSGSSDPAALSAVLAHARKRDALTLWHLLARVSQPERRQVYRRLASLVPPPSGVSMDAALHLDRAALDRWWNALGLDDVSVWRTFERPWVPTPGPRRP